jgi:hypothetical protein
LKDAMVARIASIGRATEFPMVSEHTTVPGAHALDAERRLARAAG